MTISEQIDFFFAPPYPEQRSGMKVSTLHLARREMQECFIGTIIPEDLAATFEGRRSRLFATVMVIMSAVDLLSKCLAGEDAINKAGARTQTFLRRFICPGSPDLATVIYEGCRNPLMHSFGLHNKRHHLGLSETLPKNALMVQRADGVSVLSIEELFRAFIRGVASYERELRLSPDLKERFGRIFDVYGWIGMTGGHWRERSNGADEPQG